jgi:Cell Wall Hydrolase
MLNKVYIAVPFFVGLACVGFATANAVHDKKQAELLGQDKFQLCDLSGDTCTNIAEREKMPIKIIPPLGIATAVNKTEINCLARNLTQEPVAKNIQDKIAVAFGTINRVKIGVAKSICAVIAQPRQMSWFRDALKRNALPSPENVTLAKKILTGYVENPLPECPFVSWYNNVLDDDDSYNRKGMLNPKKDKCVYKPFGTPHFYIGWR